jgi:hypothetical protein
MNAGYFINYSTGVTVEIHDHEIDIRKPATYKRLGVKPETIKDFPKYEILKDRTAFLTFVMKNNPIMRVRGHGTTVTFEFYNRSKKNPLDAIWVFGKKNLGPFSHLNIVNLATNESIDMNFEEYEELIDRGGYSAVLKAASISRGRKAAKKIAKVVDKMMMNG